MIRSRISSLVRGRPFLAGLLPRGLRASRIQRRSVSGWTIVTSSPSARPSFDPNGDILYFLSYRDVDPVYDNIYFDLNFPCGVRPFLVTLRADVKSPLVAEPRPLHDEKGEDVEAKQRENAKAKSNKRTKTKEPDPLVIDTDGIAERVLGFPVPDGRFTDVVGIDGKVLLVELPIEGNLGKSGRVISKVRTRDDETFASLMPVFFLNISAPL